MTGTGGVYEFGPYTLDVGERRLWNAGQVVPLAPKAHDVLVALVRRAGTLVTKRELLDPVWRDVAVEEAFCRCTSQRFAKVSVMPSSPAASKRCRAPAIALPPPSGGGLLRPSRCR